MRTGSMSKLRCAHFSYSFQLVLYAKHGLDVHNPVSAQGHFHQAAYILAAPVIHQPGSAFVCADTAGIFQPGSFCLSHFSLGLPEGQCPQNTGGLIAYRPCIGQQRLRIQLAGKIPDCFPRQLVAGGGPVSPDSG